MKLERERCHYSIPPTLHYSSFSTNMARKVAVIGAGMTKFMRRALETPKELAWLAAKAALDSADMKLNQIDSVVLGTAPEAFDGLHMKGEYLSDGCGAWNKPFLRCYVGGGTAVYALAQAWFHVASGL